MSRSALVPGLFTRRLALVVLGIACAGAVLVGQLWRLTVAEGAALAQDAERRLSRVVLTPTTRGRLLDRKGRVLAEDRPAYDLTVEYAVLSGEWAVKRAGRYARRVHGSQWTNLSAAGREALIDRYLPAYTERVEEMWTRVALATGVSGETLVRRQDEILDRISRTQRIISSARKQQLLDAALARGEEITTEIERRVESAADVAIREQRDPHVVVPRVSEATAFELMRIVGTTRTIYPGGPGAEADEIDVLPGVSIVDAGARDYPLERMRVEIDRSTFPGPLRSDEKREVAVDGVGVHVIGAMRDTLHREDAEKRRAAIDADPSFRSLALLDSGLDRGEYRAGDAVGRSGIEESREAALRGLRGVVTTRMDTGEVASIPAVPGRDVALTIDIALQARIQAILDPSLGLARAQPWHGDENPTVPVGTELPGAVVVLDVDTADILAMVSTPTYTRARLREDSQRLFSDPVDAAWLNRCIARPYPPGSIVKAIVLVGAVTRGNFRLAQRIECTGHLLPGKVDQYRCWIYKRFGTTHTSQQGRGLSASEALTVSCNIFFYTLGQRLGPDGVRWVYKTFGVGEPFNLGLGLEFAGYMGLNGVESNIQIGDAIFMGMGQGPVAWTPLHAANTYATLARSGVQIPPRIELGSTPEPRELGLDESAIAEALDGLDGSVNAPNGTGHSIAFESGRENIFNVPGVRVWGKTGTAEAPDIVVDPDGPGPAPAMTLRKGDHSWFVVMAAGEGEARPRYVVAVLMEYAGSGGKVSGPIANQVLHALRAEGYL